MDHRTVLPAGTVLPFPGMDVVISRCIGRGSNALVYEAGYRDAAIRDRKHHVLVKELFPLDPRGHILRGADRAIRRDAEGGELWRTHLLSFQRGNDIHLQLLALSPDRLGGNLNTFPLNNTFYTVLDDSGSRSLEKELSGKPAPDLRRAAVWCLRLLDCLEVFHGQDFLHLDISPDNVLLSGGEERVTLIDYNSVHNREEIRNGEALYFSEKEGFTPPEVLTGRIRDISFCTDLYSVAAVFYAMLQGCPPTMIQLNRKNPPDAGDSPLLAGIPSTAREQVRKILRRGLCALPEKRYGSCASMKQDLSELLNRLDGLGVSHAALWEAGRRSVLRLVKQNPSLLYLKQETELYPLRVTVGESGETLSLDAFMRTVSARQGPPVLLEGIGGAGKSTALLRTVLSAPANYAAQNPAVIYLPLYDWKETGGHFLLDRILRELRFDADTRTMEDARHALTEQLGRPLIYKGEERPFLLLLLDGLNEAAGDISGLLREITALARLPGVSVAVTGRVCPEGFSACRAGLDLLTDGDVDQALGRHGLLAPESEEMRSLLKTPLMLSLFIRTALAQNTQVQCSTGEQLVEAYLDALCGKEAPDGEQASFQTEAAVRLVLPAIAEEMQRQHAAPDDRRLLQPVTACRRQISTRTLSRAFPRWIGHGEEITEKGKTDDETWYGRMVQGILWKKLGLLTRDETGGYHIRHQILQDHLIRMSEENRRRIREARFRTGAACAAVLACLAFLLLLGYELWIKPKPYDETMSATVLDAARTQYTCAGLQYEAMLSLLDGKTGPEDCEDTVRRWGEPVSLSARAALDALQGSEGDVVPWSGSPLDFENCRMLLSLPGERVESYSAFIRAWQRLSAENREEEKKEFAAVLSEKLEADADLAWLLDRSVSAPHLSGIPKDREMQVRIGLLSLPAVQENRSPDFSGGLGYAVQKAGERSREAERALKRMPVMYEGEAE